MVSTVHPNAATHLLGFLDRMGLDGATLLEAAGVRHIEHRGVARIRRDGLVRAKGLAAARLGDPWLGIRLGAETTVDHMDVFGAALAHAGTMEEALELGIKHLAVWNEGSRADLERLTDHYRLAWTNLEAVDPLSDAIESQHSIVFIANATTLYLDDRAAMTCHVMGPGPAQPDSLPALPYRLRFEAEAYWVEIPYAAARKPPLAAHPAVSSFIERRLQELGERLGHHGSLRACLRQLLDERLARAPTLAELAHELHVSTRTLQDRLQGEGTSFSAELDAARIDRAHALLGQPELGIKEIATQLGFASISAFSRFFKQKTGEPPSMVRARRTSPH